MVDKEESQPLTFSCTALDEPDFITLTPVRGRPWLMRLAVYSGNPIVEFNTKEYPNCLPDEFAKSVVSVFEKTRYVPRCDKETNEKEIPRKL